MTSAEVTVCDVHHVYDCTLCASWKQPSLNLHDVLARSGELAKRYEARIAEQARLLGVQADKITKAIRLLDGAPLPGDPETADERMLLAVKVLRGEVDG